MEPFHKRLRRLREGAGLTMEAMARNLGVPVTTYREWEYGRELRGTKIYLKMVDILGVAIQELFTGEKSKNHGAIEQFDSIINQLQELRSKMISLL